MPVAYYGKRPSVQAHSVMTRPAAGLSEFMPATEINDNNLSACLDVFPYKNEALKLYSTDDNGITLSNGGDGRVLYGITLADKEVFDDMALLVSNSTSTYIYTLSHANTPYATAFDITSLALVVNDDDAIYSGCVFNTEAQAFAVFSSNLSKKIIWCDKTTTGSVALPFYPKKMLAHANRIFILDTGNKIWWCRAGDFHTWYGLEEDADYITTVTNVANGTYTIAKQPDVTRPLMITITKVVTLDTLGTITLVGTAYDSSAQTEVITPVEGVNITTKSWKTLTTATQAGHTASGTADTITIGIAPVGTGIVQEDQGYATLEREDTLCDFCVISGSIYIFSRSNIYVFSGTSPDTFSIQQSVSDIGVSESTYSSFYYLATAQNKAYFVFNNDIYEFNGSDAPRVISRPTFNNGSVSNNIYGSIAPTMIETFPADGTQNYRCALSADSSYLYLYQTGFRIGAGYLVSDKTNYYMYNIIERSWWYMSGINIAYAVGSTDFRSLFLPRHSKSGMTNIISDITNNMWGFQCPLGVMNDTNGEPYLITKAFNTIPSEDGTLTGIVLSVKSIATATAGIVISYSTTDDADDFVECWSDSDYHFNGDLEQIEIPLHASVLQRVHHYRLKLQVTLDASRNAVYLYNIERIYRTIGRSR